MTAESGNASMLLWVFALIALAGLARTVHAQSAELFLVNAPKEKCPTSGAEGCFYDRVESQFLDWPQGAKPSSDPAAADAVDLGSVPAYLDWPVHLVPENGFTVAARIRWSAAPSQQTAIWSVGMYDSVRRVHGTLSSLGIQPGSGADRAWTFGKHRWSSSADDPAGANTSYWVQLWDPAPPSAPTWVTAFVRYQKDARARVDVFWSPDQKSIRWEQSLLDVGFPMMGYRPPDPKTPYPFLKPSALILGAPPKTYPHEAVAQPALHTVALYGWLSNEELVALVNEHLPVITGKQLAAGLKPCNTGWYLAKPSDDPNIINTPCATLTNAFLTAPTTQASFRASCTDIEVGASKADWPVDAFLYARCKGGWEGKESDSHLRNFRRCAGAGDIRNNAGTLTCALPPGSYQSSCMTSGRPSNWTVATQADGDNLFALCKQRDGKVTESTLESYHSCNQDISNFDGGLTCGAPPPGSYQSTCHAISAQPKGDLTARCKDRRGNLIGTRLNDYKSCKGDIRNLGGNLQCDR